MKTINQVVLAAAAILSCTGLSYAQKKPVALKEPKCCSGKKCHHVTGEDKHHKCSASCHDTHQKKGQCCNPHQHKGKAKSKAKAHG